MSPVSRDRLAVACRDADRETLRSFVAALFEARGHTVERSDDGLVRLQPGDRLVAVDPGESDPQSAVDVVVAIDASPVDAEGVRILEIDDLHRQVCYAVDRDVARELLSDELDVDLPTPDRPESRGDAGDSEPPDSGRWRRERGVERSSAGPMSVPGQVSVPGAPRTLAVVGIVLAVTAAGLLAVAFGVTAPGEIAGTGPDGTTSTPADSAVLTPAGVESPAPDEHLSDIEASETNVDRPVGTASAPSRYPPGVGPSGIRDHERLAAAHVSALSNTSYTMRLSYREFVDGRLSGVHTETVRANGSRYRVSVSSLGTFRTPPRGIAGTEVFANGSRTFVRSTGGGALGGTTTDASGYLDDVARYLRWSLSVSESSVRDREAVDNRTAYLVLMTGEDYPGLEDASGNAYVTADGVIRHGRWSYRRAYRENVRIEFTIQTTNVGETTVTRPAWADDG